MESQKSHVKRALSLLGVERLVLAIHDQSFPGCAEEELGRGTPYSKGGSDFTRFISELGFNAVQFGPQGQTSLTNPSPYDSTLFSKNELSISLLMLAEDPHWQQLLAPSDVAELVAQCPSLSHPRDRSSYTFAWHAYDRALKKAYQQFVQRRDQLQPLWLAYMVWIKQQNEWLPSDTTFELLTTEYGTDDWRQWKPEDQELPLSDEETRKRRQSQLMDKHPDEVGFYQFCQFVAHQQHLQYRRFTNDVGIKLFADLQIGYSQRDYWALRRLFLPGYLLGAPPSRTNPDGQPWGYPVLNPDLYFEQAATHAPGIVLKWLAMRIDKLLMDFDGLRIDHPHGLVCPWVYDSTADDALRAVQSGARLFESPNLPDHPKLARYAIAKPSELNESVPRYADGWVKELSEQQVERYAVLIELIKQRMADKGFDQRDIICEVLSSCPFPLKAVLNRHKLGRFRVTQKAKPTDPSDVYRSDNAAPADWIMVGTHDTHPLWAVVQQWTAAEHAAWADYLAGRLEPESDRRGAFAAALVADKKLMTEAMFADLFVGPARNVSVFFADLLGITEPYNKPGVVNESNWVLSVPNDYRTTYRDKVKQREALNLPRVLALALRAKAHSLGEQALQLAQQLDPEGVQTVL